MKKSVLVEKRRVEGMRLDSSYSKQYIGTERVSDYVTYHEITFVVVE